MKLQTLHVVLVTVLLIAMGSLAFACGGDDDGDSGNGDEAVALDSYFERVKGIMDGASDRGDEIESDIDDQIASAAGIEDVLDALADGLGDFLTLSERVRDEIGDIAPPSDVEDQHRRLAALYGVTASAMDDLRSDIEEIDPDADEEKILEQITDFSTRVQTEFGSLGTEGELICFELQSIADENEIDIDLECGD